MTTTTGMLRGYTLQRTVAFIESGYFDEKTKRQIMDGLPAESKALLAAAKPAEWYPRDALVHMMRGIAAVKNDEVGSYNDLVESGRFVASEATNTFLKLLMKVLTPTLYAKKTPELWARDHRGSGHFEVDADKAHEGRLRMKLVGADGFDHIGIAGIGFLTFGMAAMGKRDFEVTQKGWSLATPSPHEILYDIRWKL
jgi:hypothetical protein